MGVALVMKCVTSYSQKSLVVNIAAKVFYALYITNKMERISFLLWRTGGEALNRRSVHSVAVLSVV